MNNYSIPITKPVSYHLTGKFEALSDTWKHAELKLYDYELFVVTKGVLYLEYNNQQYCIQKGEMLLLPPVEEPNNLRQGYQSSDCSFYWMHFDHEPLEEGTDESEILVFPEYCALRHPEKVTILMKQLQDATKSNPNYQTLCYMTTAVLCTAADDIRNAGNAESGNISASKSQLYEDILNYIRQHLYTNGLTVKKIAAHFGYNEKYISAMFAKITGVTLKQYILSKKIEQASFFLTDTDLSIQEIAVRLGYEDSNNFTRTYKHSTGFSPTKYRQAFAKRVINH